MFCGDNKGFVHIIDISRGYKLSSFSICQKRKIAGLSTNGLYCAVVLNDGSVRVHDVQNDFEFLSEVEKPIKSDVAAMAEETKKAMKAIILNDKTGIHYNPMTGGTSMSRHQF